MSVAVKLLRLYYWALDVLHHRWWQVHPAYILLNVKPMFSQLFNRIVFEGDPSLPPKTDPSWRFVWPRVALQPCTPGPNGGPYHGWYWLFYTTDNDSRCKMLPVCGLVAPRIGDGPVEYRAVTLRGNSLELFEETSEENLRSARKV